MTIVVTMVISETQHADDLIAAASGRVQMNDQLLNPFRARVLGRARATGSASAHD